MATARSQDTELPNPLITKLARFASLSADDRNAIVRASRNAREVKPNRDIISEAIGRIMSI